MNAIKKLGVALAVLLMTTATVETASAQDKIQVDVGRIVAPFSGSAFGKGLGAGLVLMGAAYGFGKIGSAALESMARQPETAGKVQTAMIIIGALLEGATFFALIVCITI